MHKIAVALILASLMFASPAPAKTAPQHHRSGVHHLKHRHPLKHRHHRRKHRRHRRHPPTVAASPSPATAPVVTPSNAPGQMIGVGDAPGCLNGANPTSYLRKYGATVLRIVLSPYYGAAGTTGGAVPCLMAAIAAGARVEIAIS